MITEKPNSISRLTYTRTESLSGKYVFHAQKSGTTTLCGCDCSDWPRLSERATDEVLADPDFCNRCALSERRLEVA